MTTYDTSSPNFVAPVADHPLSPRGRFARLAYLAWYLIASLIVAAIAIVGITIFGNINSAGDAASNINTASLLIMAIAYIVFFYFAIVFTIRRLHDLNQSGWLSLLLLVPLVNVLFMLYVMIAPGTRGSNNFGLPRPNKGWESVLGIIYIILSVLGIIAVVAMISMLGGMSGDLANLGNMANYN